MWVRGLKQGTGKTTVILVESHPMWVRGLKLSRNWCIDLTKKSHPMWVRGLKHLISFSLRTIVKVASYVGAWIETIATPAGVMTTVCRILCGCVD